LKIEDEEMKMDDTTVVEDVKSLITALFYSTAENLTNGKAGVDVRFENYPIFNQSFYICDQLKCPLYANVHLFNETFAVPNDIPCVSILFF